MTRWSVVCLGSALASVSPSQSRAELAMTCTGLRAVLLERCAEDARAKKHGDEDMRVCKESAYRYRDDIERLEVLGHSRVEINEGIMRERASFERSRASERSVQALYRLVTDACRGE